MSISFVCPCGRRYEVDDALAGKIARCRQCGTKVRIPVAAAPPAPPDPYDLDLDLAEPPGFAVGTGEPDDAPLPPAAPRGRRKAAGGADRGETGAPNWLGRLVDLLPRGDDLVFPTIGVGCLVVAGVMSVVGGFYAWSYAVFLFLGGLVFGLGGAGMGLAAAWRRGFGRFLAVLWTLLAAFVAVVMMLAPKPYPQGAVDGVVAALAGFAVFLRLENRCDLYRRALAVGSLGVLLRVSLSLALSGVVPARPANYEGPPMPGPADPPPPVASAPATGPSSAKAASGFPTLPEARRGFQTALQQRGQKRGSPPPDPPPGVFRKVVYDSPVGWIPAYLTPDPGDGARHPAIVWITGGDCNTIDEGVWTPADPKNDQSAAAYRKAGIVMMFPSLRGGNDNPGEKEGFLGEVDDVVAAARFLARESYVNPSRIYLGGHSTGGTLALLVAESTDRFRAVFCFGPVHNVVGYGPEYVPFDASNRNEVALRAPLLWLRGVGCPTFVFEGTEQPGNIAALRAMKTAPGSPLVHFLEVPGADHFSILAPTNRLVADKILGDDGPTTQIRFDAEDLARPFRH